MEKISDPRYSNQDDFFITPDRKCEQFLFGRGIRFIDTLKGETGWSYWIYQRTDALTQGVHDYKAHLQSRRERIRLWNETKMQSSTPTTA